MKRLICALLALMLLAGFALAEETRTRTITVNGTEEKVNEIKVDTGYGFSMWVPTERLPYIGADKYYYANEDRSVIVMIVPTEQPATNLVNVLSNVMGAQLTSSQVQITSTATGEAVMYAQMSQAGYTDRIYAIGAADAVICIAANYPDSEGAVWHDVLNAMIASITF